MSEFTLPSNKSIIHIKSEKNSISASQSEHIAAPQQFIIEVHFKNFPSDEYGREVEHVAILSTN